MTYPTLKSLSHELHAFADEAKEHLKDAARTSGSEASEALARSTKAVSRAADRLCEEAETVAENTRLGLSAGVREHPIATNFGTSFVISLVVALAATFALTRLSQT